MRQSNEYKSMSDEIFHPHMSMHSDNTANASSWDALNAHEQYTKIYNALKDLEEHNVKISVPEFVFIGFQSSGKTSAVSQAAKLAVGTMKHGTASRCPTRFKLVSNPQQSSPLIKVNGQICANEEALTNKTLQITNTYEQQNIFSKDIIEVRIESAQVAELTFIDLPGLIKGNAEKWRQAKTQLDELTAHFLHDQNPDGTYRYIPILVREPVDVEHDTHFEVEYIDNLVQKYGHGRKRIGWRQDTLFIVNKFDKQINRSPAASLIEYMQYCCCYGQTVLTIMNADNENTSNMTQKELNAFVDNVCSKEEQRWKYILSEFDKMDDENLFELRELKNSSCGVNKMNQILAEKMCDIVKRILPSVQRELDKAEHVKRQELMHILKQIEMCDPQKLKTQCIEFNNKFLKFSRQFYSGQCSMQIDAKYKKTWCREIDDFHVMSAENKNVLANKWQYEIQSNKLQTLLNKLVNKKKPAPTLLLIRLRMELIASAAINRIIDAWQCMVSYMTFPQYSDEDLVNICGCFGSTRQADVWTSIRNLVLNATQHLSDAIVFVAEMFRYKLKENADIIFECTLFDEFGSVDVNNKNNNMAKLFQTTLRDYKKEIDHIIDRFISSACDVPNNKTKILDKLLCEETINIGRLVYKMLNPKNKNKFVNVQKHYANISATATPPPPPLSPTGSNGSRSPSLTQSNTDLVGFRNKPEKNKLKEKKDDRNEMKFMQKYDELFYDAIHGQKSNFAIIYDSNRYDIGYIRHLAYVFWSTIKQETIRDVLQQITRLIMAPIKQHDEIVSNAIHCGVDQVEIQTIMDKLVEKTGVDVLALQKLIYYKSTVQVPKAINDLDNDELQKIYGINRQQLLKEREKKINELKEFKKLKAKTLLKIYHIQNNQV